MSEVKTNPELEALLDEIAFDFAQTSDRTGVSALDPQVIAALRATPREAYVPAEQKALAYRNAPLPLGYGQTISQPYIVALMTQLMRPRASDTLLEIGAGSGYQAAVLARLVRQVVSVEIIPALATAARDRWRAFGLANIALHCADGTLGWPAAAPYDGIIVTACARQVPPALIEQLKAGGRLLIPLGEPYGYQELTLIEKSADGALSSRSMLAVAFVPLTRSRPDD